MAKVTVIKPTINPHTHIAMNMPHKRRVAAYARVSTDQDEQFTSYELKSIITLNTSKPMMNGNL